MPALEFYRDSDLQDRIVSQVFLPDADGSVTSVEVIDGIGLPAAGVTIDGSGDTVTLSYDGNQGSVQVTADGEYQIDVAPDVFCIIKVTDYANLGATSSQMTGGFVSVKNGLFSDISDKDASDGDVEARSLYIKNAGAEITELRLHIVPSAAGETYKIDGEVHDSPATAKVFTNVAPGGQIILNLNRLVDPGSEMTAADLATAEIRYEADYAADPTVPGLTAFGFSVESKIIEIDPGLEKKVTYHCRITTSGGEIEVPIQSFSSRARIDVVGYEPVQVIVGGSNTDERAAEIRRKMDSGEIQGDPIYKQITNVSVRAPNFPQLSDIGKDQPISVFRRVLYVTGETLETELCSGLLSQVLINDFASSTSIQIDAVSEADAPAFKRSSKLPSIISASGKPEGGLTVRMMPNDIRPTDRIYYRLQSYEVNQVSLIVNENSSVMELSCG